MRGTELSVSQIEGFCAGKGNTRADAAKRNVFSTQSLDLYWISSECAGVIKKVTTSEFLLVPADDIPTDEVTGGIEKLAINFESRSSYSGKRQRQNGQNRRQSTEYRGTVVALGTCHHCVFEDDAHIKWHRRHL